MAQREQNIDDNAHVFVVSFLMQGEGEDRGNWALFPENKRLWQCCVCVSVFLCVCRPKDFSCFLSQIIKFCYAGIQALLS